MPSLLTRREDLFPLSRQVVKGSGYQYSKGHSRYTPTFTTIFQVWSFWYYLGYNWPKFPSWNPTKQRLTISLPQSRISEEKVYKSKLLFWVKSLHSCVIYFWYLLFIKVAPILMPYCVQSIGSTTKQMSPLACILVSHVYSRNSCSYKHYTWQENTLENTDKIWQYYKTFLQLVRLLLECVDHINTVNV